MVQKILVVDDDEDIRGLLKEVLRSAGYDCLEAVNGTQALNLIQIESPDLIILDIGMSGFSGFQVLRRLRKTSETPVIMLSARTDTEDKVESLELGADDYVTKPFEISEITARAEAVLRRRKLKHQISEKFDFDDGRMQIDLSKRHVTIIDKELQLTPKEYQLLRELVLNAGTVLEYHRLLTDVWGSEYGNEKKLVHGVVKRLRSKIEADPKNPKYILAVNGVGYRFQEIL